MLLAEMKDFASRFERLRPTELDRSIPRCARLIIVAKLSEEERDLLLKALRYFINEDEELKPLGGQ